MLLVKIIWTSRKQISWLTFCCSLYSSCLIDHYLEFKQYWHLENHLLLHIDMDGPSVNQLLEKHLRQNFIENSNSEFLQLRTCSLLVHTAFKKGKKGSWVELLFSSFKCSKERLQVNWEDYLKRWLSMKAVGTRVLEQIDNLREYFLNFLPNSKGFKKSEGMSELSRI